MTDTKLAQNESRAKHMAQYGKIQEYFGYLDEAIDCYKKALELYPEFGEAYNNMGVVLANLGRIDESIKSFVKSFELDPTKSSRLSNIIFYSHFHPGYTSRYLLKEAQEWDIYQRQPVNENIGLLYDKNPTRRLRIGYVSPNFRHHCQAFFMFPLLSHHNHEDFEIFCYSDSSKSDDWTERLMAYADCAQVIAGIPDASVADMIREDKIDILVDLTMHMANGRLAVFARKPAPVQACWLAYPGTTGLSAMDYRITDRYLDPLVHDSDAATGIYSEKSIQLPETFWCYGPPETDKEPPSPLPVWVNGYVTFGSLNNFCKVNDYVISLWAKVLNKVPRSKFILSAPYGSARAHALGEFSKHRIDSERIEFVTHQPWLQYLETYRKIDICLDTVPYNGHTTSLDAFWMGVPVVTLVGDTVVGRAGLSQLINLNLEFLIACNGDEYVEVAFRLSNNLEQLARLRANMRTRMRESPLMNAARFALNMETAYRTMWRTWCEGSIG